MGGVVVEKIIDWIKDVSGLENKPPGHILIIYGALIVGVPVFVAKKFFSIEKTYIIVLLIVVLSFFYIFLMIRVPKGKKDKINVIFLPVVDLSKSKDHEILHRRFFQGFKDEFEKHNYYPIVPCYFSRLLFDCLVSRNYNFECIASKYKKYIIKKSKALYCIDGSLLYHATENETLYGYELNVYFINESENFKCHISTASNNLNSFNKVAKLICDYLNLLECINKRCFDENNISQINSLISDIKLICDSDVFDKNYDLSINIFTPVYNSLVNILEKICSENVSFDNICTLCEHIFQMNRQPPFEIVRIYRSIKFAQMLELVDFDSGKKISEDILKYDANPPNDSSEFIMPNLIIAFSFLVLGEYEKSIVKFISTFLKCSSVDKELYFEGFIETIKESIFFDYADCFRLLYLLYCKCGDRSYLEIINNKFILKRGSYKNTREFVEFIQFNNLALRKRFNL